MKKSLLVAVLVVLCVGCGGYSTGIVHKIEKGYLKFVGDTYNVTFQLDEGSITSLEEEVELYEVKPGKYKISVYRDNQKIVEKIILVDDQITVEIEV